MMQNMRFVGMTAVSIEGRYWKEVSFGPSDRTMILAQRPCKMELIWRCDREPLTVTVDEARRPLKKPSCFSRLRSW
jgi:hypothetical protein